VIGGPNLVEGRVEDLARLVEKSIRLHDTLPAIEPEDQSTFSLVGICLQFTFAGLKGGVPISLVSQTALKNGR
jgi:hypothetical protein